MDLTRSSTVSGFAIQKAARRRHQDAGDEYRERQFPLEPCIVEAN
jgi:hypothetical protein